MFPCELQETCLRLFQALDTPRSLTAAIMLRYEEWDQLIELRADPSHYTEGVFSALRFKRDHQASELLRKADFLDASFDREAEAIRSFYAAELQCKKTNDRLAPYVYPLSDDSLETGVVKFINNVRKIISRVLGKLPEHIGDLKFGPGAIYESKGLRLKRGLTLGDKLQLAPNATRECVDIFSHYYWPSLWGRANAEREIFDIRVVPGNRFTTVPKTAKTDRGICIEPGANVSLQLCVGSFIRRRLKLFGIDLKNGQSLHRQLARVASLTGLQTTIDLSSASDTVAMILVKLLLPEEWYDLLVSLRSPRTYIQGRWVVLEKFSSMGNGFTFELETLIFAALCAACVNGLPSLGKDVFVYGDDIIAPTRSSRDIIAALRFFGFTPNERKTFHDGSFRESCGGDYFWGVDVRPHQIKESPNEPSQWISLANGLFRRWFVHRPTRGMRRAWLKCIEQVPNAIRRNRGPAELGDVILHDYESRWTPVIRNSQRFFKCWKPIQRRVRISSFDPGTQLCLALLGADSQGLSPRNAISGYRFGMIAYS